MVNIKKVIIIDDDEINNFLCFKIIKSNNFADQVISFLKATEALDYLKKALQKEAIEVPDIIFLDINMPEMDGWEFLEHFNKLDPKITGKTKIFMLTSSIHKTDISKSNDYDEILDYLVKPLDKQKLDKIKDFYMKEKESDQP